MHSDETKRDGEKTSSETSPEKPEAKTLSKEEQMAQFEEALKNSDWGHQPC